MRLFCSDCRKLFDARQAHIIDPNVFTADGSASVFHPWCYAGATGQITPAERDIEQSAGQELAKHKRRKPNFAALMSVAGRAPAPEPSGKTFVTHRLSASAEMKRSVDVISDYAIYPD